MLMPSLHPTNASPDPAAGRLWRSRKARGGGAVFGVLLLCWMGGAMAPIAASTAQAPPPLPPRPTQQPALPVVQQAVRPRTFPGVPAVPVPQELVQWRDLPGFAPTVESSLPTDERLRAVEVSPETQHLVAGLESDEWITREESSQALFEEPFADEQLLALLARGSLSAEAQHRLLDVVCQRLAMLPRGAIGIQMELADTAPGARIRSLIDDMPAKRSGLLRPGDRIVALNGRPVTRTRTQFSVIQVERPGQTVRLTIERDAEPVAVNPDRPLQDAASSERLEIDLVLGSTDQLDRIDVAGWGGGSRTTQIRGEQVREAMERFRPEVVEVQVARRSGIDPTPIDEHPELREMLLLRERVLSGELQITPAMRGAWFKTLALLEAQSRDPGVSEQVREFHRRVAQRFAELMPR